MFIARRGRSELTTTILAPGELADLVERMLHRWDRHVDTVDVTSRTARGVGTRARLVLARSQQLIQYFYGADGAGRR